MKRKTADRGGAILAATFRRGTGKRYDLPKDAVEDLRDAHLLKNEMRHLYRRLSRAARIYKAMGGDPKLARKHFIAKWGDPRKYSRWKERRRELGVGSATASDLVKSYSEANDRMIKRRMEGEPAEFKFRPWRGEGMLYRQLQGPDLGGVLVERAEAGEGPLWIERVGKHATFHVTIEGHRLQLPVPNYFREQANGKNRIPKGAILTAIRVKRTMKGKHPKVWVCVSYWLPAPEPPAGLPPLAVTVGWHKHDGGVRVAHVSSPLGGFLLPFPDELVRDGVLRMNGGGADVVHPARWRDRGGNPDAIRSHRDRRADKIRPVIVEALKEGVEGIRAKPAHVARWRSTNRLNRLLRHWPDTHPLYGRLRRWRARDCHLWEYEAHERDQLDARRADAWRKVAAWIADQASTIRLDVPPIAKLREKQDGEPKHVAEGGRRNIQDAAPGELVRAVRTAAMMRGVTIEEETE